MNKLLIKKLLLAFAVTFGTSLIVAVEGLTRQPDLKFTSALLVSLVTGALGAGLRAVIALLPINVVPSDAEHTLSVFKKV